jgi:hypothetical protein
MRRDEGRVVLDLPTLGDRRPSFLLESMRRIDRPDGSWKVLTFHMDFVIGAPMRAVFLLDPEREIRRVDFDEIGSARPCASIAAVLDALPHTAYA